MKQLAAASNFQPALRLGRASELAVSLSRSDSTGPVGRPGPVGLNVDVIKGSTGITDSKHVIFLHGLFGKAQSFQFLAKSKLVQQNFTCHLVDMRNHGLSEHDSLMDYESLARDIHGYLVETGLNRSSAQLMLVGHSLGAKTAMAFAMMYPNLVDRLVSLDASPVDRNRLPHLNVSTERMIGEALRIGCLKDMPLKHAVKKIKTEIEDPVLQTALLFNLNPDGSFQLNLEAIADNQANIYGFPDLDSTYEGPCLLLNGADSFQREILDDASYYRHALSSVTDDDIVMLKNAGHGLHFEQPMLVRKLVHEFLLRDSGSLQGTRRKRIL